MRAAPAHLANLGRRQGPAGEAIEGLPQGVDGRVVHQVHEGVAQVCLAVEVAGQVDEVVATGKAMLVQHGQEHVAAVIIGNVPWLTPEPLLKLKLLAYIFFHIYISP